MNKNTLQYRVYTAYKELEAEDSPITTRTLRDRAGVTPMQLGTALQVLKRKEGLQVTTSIVEIKGELKSGFKDWGVISKEAEDAKEILLNNPNEGFTTEEFKEMFESEPSQLRRQIRKIMDRPLRSRKGKNGMEWYIEETK